MVGVRNPIAGVTYLPQHELGYYLSEGVLTCETLVDAFEATCKRFPDRIALSVVGDEMSYRHLNREAELAAAAFLGQGLTPGDPMIFQLANCSQLVIAFLGCLKAGLIPVCTLLAHRESEIGQIGRLCGARGHLFSTGLGKVDMVDFAQRMRLEIPTLRLSLAVGSARPLPDNVQAFDDLVRDARLTEDGAARAKPDLDPFQVAVYQLSGGTSGVPKIIPRFHNEYLYSIRSVIAWHGFDESLVAFTPNPMMHNAPMTCFWMPALLVGGEVALSPQTTIDAIAETILRRRPTWSLLVPVHIHQLRARGTFESRPIGSAYGVVTMSKALETSAIVGAPAYCIYGMTEGLLCFTRAGDSREAIDLTVGRAVSPYDEIRIVEPGSERDVPPGGVGELLVRGPSTIRRYFGSAAANTEQFTVDGYYRSGDLMGFKILNGKRYLTFQGRVKDVVDRGGEKINCVEVETALGSHPKVASVLCVPMPDPNYGEKLCAFVVQHPGTESLSVAEAAAHMARLGLAKFKTPERIEVVSEFPMTSSGKPSKPLLKALIAEKLAREQRESAA